ncbi:serine/threonine protein kinase [Actinomadura madurae]|uniref:serine/threonine-protein kinase n=1 Tax=Actinomadura madurae TaxID=1993 RepID=UPI002026C105|nr:serine/threonine-protein kinase [Actinomadura madurae]URM95279.1 serine/threonine protein kinase [Actinomadura madurae]
MQAPLRDRDPRRLGPYRLTARLGRGGMGTVYLGEDGGDRQVAVKVINPELADDEAFHERFRREVTAARQVRRFCTAAVLDARLDGDPLYVVTEYVNGPSVEEAVKREGPLRGGDLESFAVNIATALSAIHGAGIVHRDLKPSNVLLSPTGPRVIDFGIARALDASDGPTRTGQFVGTPAYIAPELMRGEEITPAADVFSWGCVVAFAGTGRAPFGGGSLPETINRVTAGDPDLDGLDPAVRDLVARSLAKDPADRPAVKQLIQALTGEDEPPATPPTVALPASEPTAEPAEVRAEPAPAEEEPEKTEKPAPAPATSVDSVPPTRAAGPPEPPVDEPTHPVGMPAAARAAAPAKRPSPHRNHGLLMVAVGAVVAVSTVIGVLNLPGGDRTPQDSGTTAAADLDDGPPDVEDEIFDDDFSDEGSGWKTATTPAADASYRDKKYELHVLPTTTRTTAAAPVEKIPGSQLIEVKVSPKDAAGEAGVYCHGDSGYAFLLSRDGRARIARLSSGQATTVTTGTVPGLRDGDNRLQAACAKGEGGNIDLAMWVNGKPVASSAATPPSDGEPGPSGLLVVRPEDATGWPEAVFDDFSLCSL